MKHLPRPCAGCREPTSSYREDCRTCQARRRAIQTHDSPYLMQGIQYALGVGVRQVSPYRPVVYARRATGNRS